MVKFRNGPPPPQQHNEENIEDKEIAVIVAAPGIQSSGLCHELLLHKDGYQENHQLSSGEDWHILPMNPPHLVCICCPLNLICRG